jgi:hypothetical protein
MLAWNGSRYRKDQHQVLTLERGGHCCPAKSASAYDLRLGGSGRCCRRIVGGLVCFAEWLGRFGRDVMPKGPKGEKRKADVFGNAVPVEFERALNRRGSRPVPKHPI